MTLIAATAFWVATLGLAWVYVVYPVLCFVKGSLRPVRLGAGRQAPALVTVGIAVHNGADDLRARIADILDQAVPFDVEIIVASDGSTDSTLATAKDIATRDARVKVLDLPRGGQSTAQSAIFETSRSDIVVLSDVQTRFTQGCLAALVEPFRDPRIGVVTGILRWHFDARTNTARHEGMYWRYEQRVRLWESRAGWLSSGTGALLAVRRDVHRPAPAHASLDQMLPLYARAAGALVVVAPDAVGSDRGTGSLAEQFASRTRIATQGIEANLRMSRHILPWRAPGPFLALWSHKILRWATPYLAALSVLSGLALAATGAGPLYLAPAVVLVAVTLLAAVGFVTRATSRSVPLAGFGITIATVNAAFALAWLNVLTRRRVAAWSTFNESASTET